MNKSHKRNCCSNKETVTKIKRLKKSLLLIDLPNEVLYIIIRHVPVCFTPSLELTCKLFYSISIAQKRNLNLMNNASSNPNITIKYLEWLTSKGFKLTLFTMCNTIQNGNFKILKWLHDNGCPWNEWTYSLAQTYDHLDCLDYLYENGCPHYIQLLK